MIDFVYEDMQVQLTEQNFVMFAMKYYQNTQCLNIDEFHDDLKRIKYIKRLFSRYVISGELKERLILNHLIILYNSFGTEATKMLFFKIESEFWPQLKTFLLFLSLTYSPKNTVNMKKVRASIIIFSLMITSAYSQDIGNLIKGAKADANYLVEGYVSPVLKSLGYGLNQGWYNTAKPHKTLGIDITATVSLVTVPTSAQTFTIDDNKLRISDELQIEIDRHAGIEGNKLIVEILEEYLNKKF